MQFLDQVTVVEEVCNQSSHLRLGCLAFGMSQAWYVLLAHGALQDLPAVPSAQPGAGVMMAGGTLWRHLEGWLNLLSPKLDSWQMRDAQIHGPEKKTRNFEPLSFQLGCFKFSKASSILSP